MERVPHTCPSTMTGTATPAATPSSASHVGERRALEGVHAGRSGRAAHVDRLPCRRGREPGVRAVRGCCRRRRRRRRRRRTAAARRPCPPSSAEASTATAVNTSSSAAPRATSSATRRSAVCSSASRCSSARACALASAVATSSVKPAMRDSVSAAKGSGRKEAAKLTPQTRPSTMIGTPTEDAMPRPRASSTNGPVAGISAAWNRVGRPVSRTARSSASSVRRSPTGEGTVVSPHTASRVIVSSDSKRNSAVTSASTSRATSLLTAAKSSSCDTPRATSVATCRNAACSCAIRAASAREGTWATSVRSVSVARVVAAEGDDPTVAQLDHLADEAVQTPRSVCRCSVRCRDLRGRVREAELRHDGVVRLGHHPPVGGDDARIGAHDPFGVRTRGVAPPEPAGVDDDLHVVVERADPGVQIAFVEGRVEAVHDRARRQHARDHGRQCVIPAAGGASRRRQPVRHPAHVVRSTPPCRSGRHPPISRWPY